jgi:hypothetical protein
MANYFDTRLECLTNNELLKFIDPKKIIKSTWSKLRFSICDELIFESRNCTMHEDILLLSKKFPREVFLVRYYDSPEYEDSLTECYRYEDGKCKFIGYEPKYTFNDHDHIIKVLGEEVTHKLWKRIRRYLMRLDQTKESILDGELNCDILENHYDECVTSSVTIHAEFENFKLSVDKIRNSELVLHGYQRNSESEDWEEILIESKKEEDKSSNVGKDQNNEHVIEVLDIDNYEDLPS